MQAFERGERVTALRRLGTSTLEGTTVRFRPDPTIFGGVDLDHEVVQRRLIELAWLHPHLRVWFQERRLAPRGGITAWARELAAERGDVVDAIALRRDVGDVRVSIAFAWNRDGATTMRAFVNANVTPTGSHIDGMWQGLADYARAMKSPARSVAHVREAIGSGLAAIVDVWMSDPRYTSQKRIGSTTRKERRRFVLRSWPA